MKRRVVITGIGVVAPNGVGKEAYWQALMKGLSGVRSIRRFVPETLPTRIAGEVEGFDSSPYIEAVDLKKMDRSNVYALAAGLMALEDSRLNLNEENRERIGSSIGNSLGGVDYVDKEIDVMREKGPRRGSPYLAIAFFSCGTNGLLSIRLGLKGVVLTLCNGNTSGTDALGMAYRTIQSGRADVMFAGGTEAPLVPLFVGSFARDGFLSKRNEEPARAARPFDLGADGMVLGEGAGILVMEELEHAKARGAHIYAEVTGYASGNSAFDVMRPDVSGKGLVSTMRRALDEAGTPLGDVDVVHAQGFSSRDYDAMESRCMWELFRHQAKIPSVTAVSSWTGNALGALGGFQGAASALMIERRQVPAIANLSDTDNRYSMPYVRDSALERPINVIVQNAYCFLGKSSSLILRRIS